MVQTKNILEGLAKADSRILTDPETTVAVAELADYYRKNDNAFSDKKISEIIMTHE